MRKFEIVLVSTEAPYRHGNGTERGYWGLATGLSTRGHRVRWLAASSVRRHAHGPQISMNLPGINLKLYPYQARPMLRRKWETLRRPYSYFISDRLVQDLKVELGNGYDVLHLEHTWAGWLGIGARRAFLSVPALAMIDSPPAGFLGFRSTLSGTLMRRTERRLISQFENIRVLTPRDARIVQGLNHSARVCTIPLAIESSLYSFKVEVPPTPTIGLIGSMDWHPTRAAAIRLLTSIWPQVRAYRRDTRLLIVGWGARESLARFVNMPDVTILENVPETEPYFRKLSILAYPVIAGSGMKVKVLEAMAYGVPVVTTSDGIEGIDAVDGVHALLSDEDHEIAAKIVRLLGASEMAMEMRVAARRLVEDRYSPGPVISQIERLYGEIAQLRG